MNHDCKITRSPHLHTPKEHGASFRIETCHVVLHKREGLQYFSIDYFTRTVHAKGIFFTVPTEGVQFTLVGGDAIGLN